MKNQIVFMDTEFTNFCSPNLISIGLVASTGEEFYAEVPYCLNECTEFVKSIVIPLLNSDLCSHDDLRVRLINWFSSILVDSILTVCYESPFDERLFMHVFNGSLPTCIRIRALSQRNISKLLRYQYHVKSAMPEHHALNDARALRYAFTERPGRSM